jgi:hypothetical protein
MIWSWLVLAGKCFAGELDPGRRGIRGIKGEEEVVVELDSEEDQGQSVCPLSSYCCTAVKCG